MEGINFALKHVDDVSWAELNVLTQTRKTYQAEGLEELTRAIEAVDANGRPHNELFHPIMVNRLEPAQARQYLDDLNSCHGTQHRLEDLAPDHIGMYKIVIAGHRRRLATGEIISRQGADPTVSTVPCSVYESLSFREALRKQIDENTHQQLSVTEVARAIQATYKYGIARGDYRSIGDCVRDLPFGEDKVRSALKFCELPDILQDWVEAERLPYGAAVALHPMMDGLRSYYHDMPEEAREATILEYMTAYAIKIINHRWSKDVVRQQVTELLESRRTDQQLYLFQQDEYRIARRYRQQVTRELFSGGINRLRQFRETRVYQDMPAEHIEAMREELARLLEVLGGTATRSGDEAPLALEFATS